MYLETIFQILKIFLYYLKSVLWEYNLLVFFQGGKIFFFNTLNNLEYKKKVFILKTEICISITTGYSLSSTKKFKNFKKIVFKHTWKFQKVKIKILINSLLKYKMEVSMLGESPCILHYTGQTYCGKFSIY